MIKTIVILLVTLVVVPWVSYQYGSPLTEEQSGWLRVLVIMAMSAAAYCFVVSELTGNYSQVDKLWSILPVLYAGYVAYEVQKPLTLLMFLLVAAWGARLTYNFARRGAYRLKFWEGEEDYRWAILRARPELGGPWRWRLFNLFFISIYQNALILLFSLPIVVAAVHADDALGWNVLLPAVLMIGFIVMEYVADQQQWDFQKEKYRRVKSGEPAGESYGKGFTHTGLWALMRHPNYTAEQALWICFYLVGAAASAEWFNWSVSGCLLLLVLFQGSSDFSEEISASKYPGYRDYQRTVGRFLPRLGK